MAGKRTKKVAMNSDRRTSRAQRTTTVIFTPNRLYQQIQTNPRGQVHRPLELRLNSEIERKYLYILIATWRLPEQDKFVLSKDLSAIPSGKSSQVNKHCEILVSCSDK